MTEKLQKILSRAGIASRRALEQMIDQGRVTVNGKMATIGDRYEADDILVKIDGKVVLTPDSQKVSCRVLMYHKPEGELTTLSDPKTDLQFSTIFQSLLPVAGSTLAVLISIPQVYSYLPPMVN